MFFGANVDTIPHVGRRIACLLHEVDICVHLMQPAPWFLLMVGVPANHFHHSNVPLRLHGTLTTTLLSSEAVLVERGLIRGVIGLPANLFYGTGIPACIVVIDKEDATTRKGIFMIDASKAFRKDGAKNRLRERDIHRIVDVFNGQRETPGYARMVPLEEIASEANDYNLNIPRYIESSELEDLHDLGDPSPTGLSGRTREPQALLSARTARCAGRRARRVRVRRSGLRDHDGAPLLGCGAPRALEGDQGTRAAPGGTSMSENGSSAPEYLSETYFMKSSVRT